uniref:Reverse transcriptase/retrotransposon-derived protein RNase H-like domain-containing protein n=1 Tax=Phytophthora ramorum TaxID=164328 RepID=H3H4K2_PHYRM
MSGTRYTVDPDGDVEMSIPQPIFEVIRAPELSSWDHAALIEWHREWERYVEKIRHRFTTTGETYENVVTTVKGSVKRKTLKNLAMHVLKKPVDDVTDADIMSAVQARYRTLKNEFVPDVASLFHQSLRMDLSVDGCDARVFRYYEVFNGIVESNGLQRQIGAGSESDTGYKSRMKARCRLLVENLQPPVLKAQISRLIELERRNSKRDVKASKQVRPPQRSSDGSSMDGASRDSAPAPTAPCGAVATPRHPRPPPQDDCLVCKGAHWLKDYPTATNTQKEAARQQYQSAKEQRAGSVRSKAVRAGATRNMVRVNGLLEVAYIADTGAYQSVIPTAMADSLLSLDSPVSVTLADGSVQVCEMEVVLDLELVTIAGAVNLRAVPCLVLEGEGDEFLLGKDALKRLGIDVDQTLAQLADSTLLEDEEEEFPVGDELHRPPLQHWMNCWIERLLTVYTTAVREMLELFPEIWREAAEFIREYVKSLVAEGLVTKNNAARWACAVVPVRKPGSRDKFRLTIDYRPVNRLTIPIAGVMPSTATVMEVLLGKKANLKLNMEKSSLSSWRSSGVGDYARVIAPLHAKLEAEKKKIGKRNRNALQVATQWSNEERDAFKDVVSLVRDSALMVHPDPDTDLCVFTDASLSGFSIVVAQVRQWQFGVAVKQQDHQLVICKGGMFEARRVNAFIVQGV